MSGINHLSRILSRHLEEASLEEIAAGNHVYRDAVGEYVYNDRFGKPIRMVADCDRAAEDIVKRYYSEYAENAAEIIKAASDDDILKCVDGSGFFDELNAEMDQMFADELEGFHLGEWCETEFVESDPAFSARYENAVDHTELIA